MVTETAMAYAVCKIAPQASEGRGDGGDPVGEAWEGLERWGCLRGAHRGHGRCVGLLATKTMRKWVEKERAAKGGGGRS